jgi:hypothetical protein
VKEKYILQPVSRQWNDNVRLYLQNNKLLIITDTNNGASVLHRYNLYRCPEDPIGSLNDILVHKLEDIDFWKYVLLHMINLQCVYVDVYTDDEDLSDCIPHETWDKLFNLLMQTCFKILKCVIIPNYCSPDEESFFGRVDCLPQLQHLKIGQLSSIATKQVLQGCSNLKRFVTSTTFSSWADLPNGLLELRGNNLKGFNSLLSSKAVESLETLETMELLPEVFYGSYYFRHLKKISLAIVRDGNGSLEHLARILSFCPVLEDMTLMIKTADPMEGDIWSKVLSQCENLIRFNIWSGNDVVPDVKNFQDHFALAVSKYVIKIEELTIPFHLSSQGLKAISTLKKLKKLQMTIYVVENTHYDSVFDTESLESFLRNGFDGSLQSVRIVIPCTLFREPIGEYLVLKKSILDAVTELKERHNLISFVDQEARRGRTYQPNPEKIAGMVYLRRFELRHRTLQDHIHEKETEVKKRVPLFLQNE